MNYKIIIGDDDQLFSALLKSVLEQEGHSVSVCDSPKAFRRAVRETGPDAVFLDVMFGSEDGRELCRKLRGDAATRKIAVIMVTAVRREIEDISEGLDQGADDYLLKPLDRRLVLSKLSSVMRRFRAPEELAPALDSYGLKLDPLGRRVGVRGREIPLTRLEFDLLTYFLRRPGTVVTGRQMLEEVFGYDPDKYGNPATLHVHIARLRQKLGKAFAVRLATLVNAGYRLD